MLPAPADYEVQVPPVRTAWYRRIAGHNVWLFYRVRAEVLYVLYVTRSPPVPLEISGSAQHFAVVHGMLLSRSNPPRLNEMPHF